MTAGIEARPAGLLSPADQLFSDRAVMAASVAGVEERESAWAAAGRIADAGVHGVAGAGEWPRRVYLYAALLLRHDERRRETPLLADQVELINNVELLADRLEEIDERRSAAIRERHFTEGGETDECVA